jgi:hypothetical protein
MRLAMCLDEHGAWLHWPGDSAAPFSRVRVEIDVGSGRFVPLIDGPLVSIDAALDALPGRSTASMVVRDDSAYLNRDEDSEAPFENRSDSDIAEELFGRFEQIASTRIDATDPSHESVTRRVSVLQFLRERAAQADRHACVLPGDSPGRSIGCFMAEPEGPADLPPLVLIGAGRNLANARVEEDPDGAEITVVRSLRVSDQGVTSFETSAADLGLMRDLPAVPADLTPRRALDPADNLLDDPQAVARARARRRGHVYKLSSQVVPGCYGAVLAPYLKVRVDAGRTPYSGDYLITKVIHRITPSLYAQELQAKTNSVTAVDGAAVAEALGGGLKLSVSASAGVF